MRVTLGAEVARSYLMLRGVQAQQALVAEHRLIATELLRLTDSREHNSFATRLDVAAACAELTTVEARAIQQGQQADGLLNTLALLLDERLRTASAFPSAPATSCWRNGCWRRPPTRAAMRSFKSTSLLR